VNGLVDDQLRALISLPIGSGKDGQRKEITFWIDTAFNGSLVIPNHLISELQLKKESSTEAILADGSLVELETFACFFSWFGKQYETQVIANDGQYALLGTSLLNGHRLLIDYTDRVVELL
jgi:clan AA aspartic protease